MKVIKKIFLFIALCAFIFLHFSSCAKKSPCATEVLFDALNALEELPSYEIYYSGAPEYSESVMTSEKADILYRDENMVSYAESFACALGEDDSVWEIHVFIARSSGDAGFIENALIKRLELLQKRDIYIYDPEIYEKRISDAKVFRSGKTVCLVVCDDNLKIIRTIKSS